MANRKPLAPRNRDLGREGGGKIARKGRYRFPLLNKATLVAQVNTILEQVDASMPQVILSEEDVVNPTALKINQVYFACFVEVFDVSPDLSTQPSFMVDHPELLDDFAARVQFYRVMKRLMEYCAVPDFSLTDIVNPDSKRTCRNLSAIVNFIKFHIHMAREGQEQEEAITTKMTEYAAVKNQNSELKENLAKFQFQKQEEYEHEEELKQTISQQEERIQFYVEQEVALEKHLQIRKEEQQREEQRTALLQSELDKVSQRNDDLRKQIVTSPDKLRARLHKLQQEIEETKASTQDSDTLMRMWESLATRAQHIPNVLKGLNEDMELLITKTKKERDLQSHLEAVQEQLSRQKQALKEGSAKHQNLLRHLKYVEEESQQMCYDDQKLSLSHFKSELDRDVRQLQSQAQSIENTEELYRQQIKEMQLVLEAKRAENEKSSLDMKKMLTELEKAVEAFVENCIASTATHNYD